MAALRTLRLICFYRLHRPGSLPIKHFYHFLPPPLGGRIRGGHAIGVITPALSQGGERESVVGDYFRVRDDKRLFFSFDFLCALGALCVSAFTAFTGTTHPPD